MMHIVSYIYGHISYNTLSDQDTTCGEYGATKVGRDFDLVPPSTPKWPRGSTFLSSPKIYFQKLVKFVIQDHIVGLELGRNYTIYGT